MLFRSVVEKDSGDGGGRIYVCALFSAARGLDRHVGDACQSLSLQIGQNSRNNSGQTWRLPKLPQTQNYLRCCCSLHIPCMFSGLFLVFRLSYQCSNRNRACVFFLFAQLGLLWQHSLALSEQVSSVYTLLTFSS